MVGGSVVLIERVQAKWGEGDPRWVVEERKDGANVNGWHWSAVSVFDEANALLSSLVESETTNSEIGDGCRITKVHTNCRKGKIRLTYDLAINFKWTANPASEGEEAEDHYSGLIKFSEVIDHEPEGEVTMKTGKDKPNASAVNRTLKTAGVERCIELISMMLNMTTEKHSEIFMGSAEGAAAAEKR